jgi:hypothetical protein
MFCRRRVALFVGVAAFAFGSAAAQSPSRAGKDVSDWVGTWKVVEFDGRAPRDGDPVRLIVTTGEESKLVDLNLAWEYRGAAADPHQRPTGCFGAFNADSGELGTWIPFACGPRGWNMKAQFAGPDALMIAYTEDCVPYAQPIEEFTVDAERKQHLVTLTRNKQRGS